MKPTKFNEVTGLSEEVVTPQQLAKSSYFQEIFFFVLLLWATTLRQTN